MIDRFSAKGNWFSLVRNNPEATKAHSYHQVETAATPPFTLHENERLPSNKQGLAPKHVHLAKVCSY